jgi:hypothetical protein
MLELKNKFAIGCLVQWYEIELIEEYLQSVKQAIEYIGDTENIIVDITFTTNQDLEKIDESQATMDKIEDRFCEMMRDFGGDIVWGIARDLTTIADYRREFNDKYCEKVDVLMWGETDALIPRQTFEILDNLHNSAHGNNIYKYVAFFGTCKMWDKSWESVEHTEFTIKDHREDLQGDPVPWWDVRHNSTLEEMNAFNDKVEDVDIRILKQPKFNGCGLVISADLVKAGVNIPRSVFFVHEDTAFQNIFTRLMGDKTIQFVIKNIFLVHNRRHPDKRMYVLGETGETVNRQRMSNDWYAKGNKWCEHNAYSMFNQVREYTWKDIFNE